VNYHGEPNARLSRNQRLLPEPVITTPRWMELTFALCFNSPQKAYAKLCEHWIDKISYASHWRVYMRNNIEEWRNTMFGVSVFGGIYMSAHR